VVGSLHAVAFAILLSTSGTLHHQHQINSRNGRD
jgi:hypothetical protein